MRYKAAVLLCLCLQQAHAQIRTIIPAEKMETVVSLGAKPEDYDVYTAKNSKTVTNVTFNLSTLPDNATVDSAALWLMLDEDAETVRLVGEVTTDTRGTAIRNKNKGNYRKGDEVLLATDDSKLFAGLINQGKNAGKTITIRISTQLEDKRYKIYNTTRNGTDAGKIPRLVVYYRPEIKQVAWGGYLSDAQHTAAGIATFPNGDKPTALKSKKVVDKQEIKGLVFNNDQLLFTNQTMGATILHAVDPITGRIATLNTRLAPPTFNPVISRDGYYYHAAANEIYRIKMDDLTAKHLLPMRVNSAPVLGRNGGLYLTTDTFVRAYSPPPLYTLLWRYSIGNTGDNDVDVSPVSLSNDDSLAYVIFGKRDNPVSYLVAINTISKKVDTVILELQNGIGAMPAIAVNNSDYLYFINGRTRGNTLYIFDKHLRNKTTISNYARISHPVISNNNVYVVADSKLLKLQGNKCIDSMSVDTTGADQLAADKDDNIYILSGSKLTLCTFKKAGADNRPVSRDLDNSSEFYNLLVAPDGSVYVNTNKEIFAIRPSSFLNRQYTVSDLSFRHNITYRSDSLSIKEGDTVKESSGNIFVGSDHIHVLKNVTFESSTDNTFESGKMIKISTGFRVRKGAKVAFKTGY